MFLLFLNDTAPTEIYTLSLHDALPICRWREHRPAGQAVRGVQVGDQRRAAGEGIHARALRSEEHTSELQSLTNLVCRLLLEKKKTQTPPRLAGVCTQLPSIREPRRYAA